MYSRTVLTAAICSFLAACASTTPIQPVATSKSGFEGAVFSGETVVLDKATPGAESYRLFQQGATGFVPLSAVRSDVEQIASTHCDRKGKVMHGIIETDARPPFILGNFPRVELVFECIEKPQTSTFHANAGKYARLAQLKKLLDNGTLTQQEFESEKAKILAAP